MNDDAKINVIMTAACVPMVITFFWFVTSSSYSVILSPLLYTQFGFIIFSVGFAFFVWALHPRCRHWRKMYNEFCENYRYKGAGE